MRWKINADEDWGAFQTHIADALPSWQSKYSKWARLNTRHVPRDVAPVEPAAVRPLHATLYSDGASRGNPGPASCGGVIYLNKHKPDPSTVASGTPIHSYGVPLGTMSNNEAEYRGLLVGLQAAHTLGVTHLTAHVDSLLVCKQIQGMYQVRHNTLERLYGECKMLTARLQSFRIVHVLRGLNTEADGMCNRALDTNSMIEQNTAMSPTETGLSPSQLLLFQQQHELQRQKRAHVRDEEEGKEAAMPTRVTQDEIDECWRELHDITINTAHNSIGTITIQQGSKEWWSRIPNMSALHDAYRLARRRKRAVRRRGRVPPSISVLVSTQLAHVKAKSEFLTAVRTARSECWH